MTPPHIVPEWYFLAQYAILRGIPNKLLGVIALVASILILLILPFLHVCKIRSSAFRPIYKKFYWIFLANFLLLIWLGSQPAEDPYVICAQLASTYYFGYFLIITPFVGWLENYLFFNSGLEKRDTAYPLRGSEKIISSWKIKINNLINKFKTIEDSKFLKSHKHLRDIVLGIKKSLNTPKLPPHLEKFHKSGPILILRVCGSLSFFCLIFLRHFNFYLLIWATITCFTYSLYMFYITICKFKHFRYLLRTGQLDIRNSPRRKFYRIGNH